MVRAVCFLLVVCILQFSSIVSIASEISLNNKNSTNISESQTTASTTKEELLLFYEEKDLVVATKRKIPLRKAPAIATVVTAEEIKSMGARNLMDILKRVPGIGVSISELPTKHAIEARGIRTKNSEKVLIMIDGHRMNNQILGEAVNVFGDLSVENIKRVEIVRGPGSALYGANAFVAVINVVTKEADDIKGLEITAGGGSFDTQHVNVLLGHDRDEFKIAGYFDHLDTNGPRFLIEEDAQTINDRNHGTNASVAPGKTLEWIRKSDMGLNVTYGDLNFKGRFIGKKRGPYIGVGSALNDETVQRFDQFYADLIYNKNLSDNIDITARLYADQFNFDIYWEIFPEGYRGTFPDGLIGNPKTKNRTLGGEIATNYTITNHILTTGIVFENAKQFDTRHIANFNPNTYAPLGSLQDVTSWGNWNKDVERNIWGIYAQDVWNITDNATLTAGLRHDHYSDFGGTTNPRVGFVWEFIEDITLKLLYGSAFRAPTFTELYTINNPAEKGKPDLKSERIRTYEVGLEYRFLKNYTLKLNYFYNDINDLIVLGSKPSPTEPAPYINKGGAVIKGFETELLFNFGNGNYGYANLSYQHPKDSETDKRLPDVPSQRANAGVNLALWKHLNTNVNISWIGKRPRADGDSRAALSSSTTVDLTLIAKKLYKDLEIMGSVYNLFDKDYRDPSPYPVKVPNDYPTNARTFLMEVRYKF